ncbi:50S ribosomal protein L32e [Candidatus Bathyarchaeota archaeon A05DMB-5]|jgi:large subunit ribosomal protein L32e|nr:50S ribosomal protein L32e [Candidatus Bathyarchaeota archaeon A05DMB-5]
MAASEKTLKLRERIKKKKPAFVRQESWRYIRLKKNWRKPKGIDNKMRKKVKGWPATVNVGYRGPKAARGLHPSGYKEVLVYNTEDLKEIDPKMQAIRIAHTVGKRKRARILVEARKKKITILNLKEAKEEVKEEKMTEEAEEKEEMEKEEALEEEKEAEEKKKAEKPKRKREKTRKSKRTVEKQ